MANVVQAAAVENVIDVQQTEMQLEQVKLLVEAERQLPAVWLKV